MAQYDDDEDDDFDEDEINDPFVSESKPRMDYTLDIDTPKAKGFLEHFVILPQSKFKSFWNVVVCFLLLYTAIVFPYKLAFLTFRIQDTEGNVNPLDATLAWDVVGNIIDILFWMDLLINFWAAYYDANGRLVDKPRDIACAYLKGLFLFDLVACLPEELFQAMLSTDSEDSDDRGAEGGKTFRLLRLNRLGRISRLMRLMRLTRLIKVGALFKRNPFLKQLNQTRGARIMKFTAGLTFCVHLLACGWYIVASLEDDPSITWVARRADTLEGFQEAPAITQWLHSMYFVFTVFTTVGFGDIYAVTDAEIAYALTTMLIGAVVHSIIVSEMINVVTHVDEADLDYSLKKDLIQAFCRHARIAQRHESQLVRHLMYHQDALVRHDRGQMQSLISTNFFPRRLAESIADTMFQGKLNSNKFFQFRRYRFKSHTDARLPLMVAVGVSARTVLGGQILYRTGDHPTSVFLVLKGTLAMVGLPTPKGVAGPDVSQSPDLEMLRKSPSQSRKSPNTSPDSVTIEPTMTNIMVNSAPPDSLWPYHLCSCRNYLGEFELLFPQVRRSSARCESEQAELLMLPQKQFQCIWGEFPKFSMRLRRDSLRRETQRRRLARRLRQSGQGYHTLAVVWIQRFWRLRTKLRQNLSSGVASETLNKGMTMIGDIVLSSELEANAKLEHDLASDAKAAQASKMTSIPEEKSRSSSDVQADELLSVIEDRIKVAVEDRFSALSKKQDALFDLVQDLLKKQQGITVSEREHVGSGKGGCGAICASRPAAS